MKRTLEEINRKIAGGSAIVLTAREVEELMVNGKEDRLHDVYVVTTGTMGLMSGTYALLSFRVSEAGLYRRFIRASINGVPATVGPCPNERLGIIDVIVLGTSESEERRDYGGSFLFRDLVGGKGGQGQGDLGGWGRDRDDTDHRSDAHCQAAEFQELLQELPCLREPVGPGMGVDLPLSTIPPDYGGLTFSGCGHLNPLQNDPALNYIGIGPGS